MTKQILNALDFIHNLRLVHCDLKPENIFITRSPQEDLHAKIGDLGTLAPINTTGLTGTADYMSPDKYTQWQQKALNDYQNTTTEDSWALGCTLYELYAPGCKERLAGCTQLKIYQLIQQPEMIPLEIQPILKGLLARNADERWTVQQAVTALEGCLSLIVV